MSQRRYSKEHEWVEVDGNTATIGISDYAQEQMGDVVYVELPEVGKTLVKGDEAAVVESVKAASEVYAVISGEVSEVNESLGEEPGKVNSDAESDGWFLKMTITDPGELDDLMDEEEYMAYLKEVEG